MNSLEQMDVAISQHEGNYEILCDNQLVLITEQLAEMSRLAEWFAQQTEPGDTPLLQFLGDGKVEVSTALHRGSITYSFDTHRSREADRGLAVTEVNDGQSSQIGDGSELRNLHNLHQLLIECRDAAQTAGQLPDEWAKPVEG